MLDALEIYNAVEKCAAMAPGRDVFEIIKNQGIILLESTALDNLLGFYSVVIGRKVIILNSKLSETQKKEVAAHEFGHAWLHGETFAGELSNEYFSLNSSESEYEANAFAAHLLITDAELREYGENYGYSVWDIAKIKGINVNFVLIKLREMNRMGCAYNIPYIPEAKFLGGELPSGDGTVSA